MFVRLCSSFVHCISVLWSRALFLFPLSPLCRCLRISRIFCPKCWWKILRREPLPTNCCNTTSSSLRVPQRALRSWYDWSTLYKNICKDVLKSDQFSSLSFFLYFCSVLFDDNDFLEHSTITTFLCPVCLWWMPNFFALTMFHEYSNWETFNIVLEIISSWMLI